MSGLNAVLGKDAQHHVGALETMKEVAPWRGSACRRWAAADVCVLLQQRTWGAPHGGVGLAVAHGVMVATVGCLYLPHLLLGDAAAATVARCYRNETLQQIDGPLAFVLWDFQRQRCLARRDPFGVRALFFRDDGVRLWFASEAKQLAHAFGAVPRFDLASVDPWLDTHFDWCRTSYVGIHRVGGGHLVEGCGGVGRWRQRSWWRPPAIGQEQLSPDQAIRRVRVALVEACRDTAAQVEGVLLSSGLDSSCVAAGYAHACRTLGHRLPLAITASYPRQAWDEVAAARRTAQHLGMLHHVVQPLPDLLGGLAQTAALHDGQAFGVVSNWRQILTGARDRGLRVVADGHDGDGLFGCSVGLTRQLLREGHGWTTLQWLWGLRRVQQRSLWRLWRHSIAPVFVPGGLRCAYGTIVRALGWRGDMYAKPRWLGPRLAKRWRLRSVPWCWTDAQLACWQPRAWWALETSEREELTAGVEVVRPLYHPKVVDVALRLPAWIKHLAGHSRGALASACAPWLPDAVTKPGKKVDLSAAMIAGITWATVWAAAGRGDWPHGWIDPAGLRDVIKATGVADPWQLKMLSGLLIAADHCAARQRPVSRAESA